MYLSGQVVGLSYLSFVPPNVVPTAFEKVTLYGQQKVDYLWIKNTVMTDAEIDSITINNTPVWDTDTILLANYNNTINAGNIAILSNPIIKWTIQRQEEGSLIRKTLTSVSNTVAEYIDYTASGQKSYQYFIFPATSSETGEPLATNTVSPNFYNWALIDPITNVTFLFDFNLESNEISNEINRTEYQTYTKYNKVSRGSRDFIRGGVKCTAGYINANGQYESPISYLDQLRETINNGNSKYLKSRKGDVWLVDTHDFKYNYMDAISDQPQQISFSFMEIGAV